MFSTAPVEANKCYIQWVGQTSNITNPVVLQVYNLNSTTWETVDQMQTTYGSSLETYGSDHAFYGTAPVDTDFTLSASLLDLTNYKDGQGIVTCRVYQLDS